MRDIPASCLIANPPYIPAPDDNILMPALYGGEDGANLTRVNTMPMPQLLQTNVAMLVFMLVACMPSCSSPDAYAVLLAYNPGSA